MAVRIVQMLQVRSPHSSCWTSQQAQSTPPDGTSQSMVQPPDECFCSGDDNGFRPLRAGQWVRLPARGFLLVFFSNDSHKTNNAKLTGSLRIWMKN